MNVLYLTASPTVVEMKHEDGSWEEHEFEKLDLWPELDEITESLFDARLEKSASLEIVPEMRKEDLKRYVDDDRRQIDVLHYSGHGVRADASETGGPEESRLLVHGKQGAGDFVSAKFVKQQIEGKDIDVFVLNCCWAEPIVTELKHVVPFVIGTTNRLRSDLAASFTKEFYGALARGCTLGEACREAAPECAIEAERELAARDPEGTPSDYEPKPPPDEKVREPLYRCEVRDWETWDKTMLAPADSASHKMVLLQDRIEKLRGQVRPLLMTEFTWVFCAFLIAFAGFVLLNDIKAAANTESLSGLFHKFLYEALTTSEWLKFEPFAVMTALAAPSVRRITATLWLLYLGPMAQSTLPILGAQAQEKVETVMVHDHFESISAWLDRIEK